MKDGILLKTGLAPPDDGSLPMRHSVYFLMKNVRQLFQWRSSDFNRTRNLTISFPNQQLNQINVSNDYFMNVSVLTDLRKGGNIIRFDTQDGCQKPSDIPELNTSDKRCLSIAVQNLSFS